MVWCKALFWNTSAQRLYYHIDSTEQFYDREQTQCDIYCNGCAHRCIAGIVAATATVAATIAATATRVVVAARVFQFRRQTNDFTFGYNIRTAIGIAAAIIQISCACDIGFCGTKQCDFHGVGVGSVYAADGAAIRASKFQSIIKYITQFQIPAAFLERTRAFAQNIDSAQLRVMQCYSSGIYWRDDDISITHHVVAAAYMTACHSGRT